MRVLIVKTSSMGDVLHTLPALTDAGRRISNIRFDWVVEEGFQEIPRWHPLVDQVIPIALRRWRKKWLQSLISKEFWLFVKKLRQQRYDLIIDAQGLVKSAVIGWFSRGVRAGLDRQSIREPMARFGYQKKYAVNPELHAITRTRQLFAQALGYEFVDTIPDYGIARQQFLPTLEESQNYLMFLHGTTWPTKHWPETYWLELAKIAEQAGWQVHLPWGNAVEQQRAETIAKACANVMVLPRMNLLAVAKQIAGAKAAVAVDTGLGHLAAALNVPTISLYGPTDPRKIGTRGKHQIHLSAQFTCSPCEQKLCTYPESSLITPPCFSTVPPRLVWEKLQELIK